MLECVSCEIYLEISICIVLAKNTGIQFPLREKQLQLHHQSTAQAVKCCSLLGIFSVVSL